MLNADVAIQQFSTRSHRVVRMCKTCQEDETWNWPGWFSMWIELVKLRPIQSIQFRPPCWGLVRLVRSIQPCWVGRQTVQTAGMVQMVRRRLKGGVNCNWTISQGSFVAGNAVYRYTQHMHLHKNLEVLTLTSASSTFQAPPPFGRRRMNDGGYSGAPSSLDALFKGAGERICWNGLGLRKPLGLSLMVLLNKKEWKKATIKSSKKTNPKKPKK